jgi:hypothetical protein
MAANPLPSLITAELWRLWEETAAVTPGIRLGGIYANKSCYHNTVSANKAKWPGAYCIKLPLDLNDGPKDKARGIDWTMSDAEMVKRTGYLKRAADHPIDNRLQAMREFIGTIDNKNVFCYIRDTDHGPWRFDGGRDSTHLWHIHGSFWTAYVGNWEKLRKISSVWSGQIWEDWLKQEGEDDDMNATELLNFIRTQPILWPSTAMKDRMVERGWPVAGMTLAQLLCYTFESSGYTIPAATAAKLEEILVAAQDDGNVEVQLPPEYLLVLQDIRNNMATEEDVRDAVADLGEGGSSQVRADT